MPRLRFSERAIERLGKRKRTGEQELWWDEAHPGLGILTSGKTSTMTYMAKGQLNRKPKMMKLGRVGVITLEEARDAAREFHRSLRLGIDPGKKKPSSTVSLRDACDAYVKAHALAPRTKVAYVDIVHRYFEDWLDIPLGDITLEMAEKRHKQIAADVEAKYKVHSGKATANSSLRVLRAIYNYASRRAAHTPFPMPANPVMLHRQWHRVAPREGHVTIEQLPAFFRAIMNLDSPVGRDYLLLVLFTGLRRREAAGLRWDEIDPKSKTLSIPGERNKSGRRFDLPLSSFVHDLLATRRKIGKTEHVFWADSKSGHVEMPRYWLQQVAAECGVNVTTHDLRRTFLTIAESCEISPQALKALANHSQGSDITSRYVMMNVERLRKDAQKVCDRLKELCQVASTGGGIRMVG